MKKTVAPVFHELLLEKGVIKDQVYHALRNAILDGRLAGGSKIPSSRAMAEMMAISRNSVIAGFDRLTDEGYLETRKGSGTFVARSIPDRLTNDPFPVVPRNTVTQANRRPSATAEWSGFLRSV